MSDRTYNIIGWSLFILSAIGFIKASADAGDAAGLTGGILFLIACFVFLVPLLRKPPKSGNQKADEN